MAIQLTESTCRARWRTELAGMRAGDDPIDRIARRSYSAGRVWTASGSTPAGWSWRGTTSMGPPDSPLTGSRLSGPRRRHERNGERQAHLVPRQPRRGQVLPGPGQRGGIGPDRVRRAPPGHPQELQMLLDRAGRQVIFPRHCPGRRRGTTGSARGGADAGAAAGQLGRWAGACSGASGTFRCRAVQCPGTGGDLRACGPPGCRRRGGVAVSPAPGPGVARRGAGARSAGSGHGALLVEIAC
jgi:hypothetical protein